MASITIGGTVIQIPQLSFYLIEKGWPFFRAAQAERDPIAATAQYLGFIFAILEDTHPEFENLEALKKAMRVSEMNAVPDSVNAILVENEMIAAPGEPAPAVPAAESVSTETAPDSSANSSPPE